MNHFNNLTCVFFFTISKMFSKLFNYCDYDYYVLNITQFFILDPSTPLPSTFIPDFSRPPIHPPRCLHPTLFLANLSMFSVGSEPMESRQTMGVPLSLSAHMESRSSTRPSAYCGPRDSAM